MLAFILPCSVLKGMEIFFSNFFWNNKMHGWKWEAICRPKEEGGVGIRKLCDINQASRVRLIWRLLTSSSLWSHWMCAHYLNGHQLAQASSVRIMM